MKVARVRKTALLLATVAGFAVMGSASTTADATLQEKVQGKLKSKEFQQVTVKSNNGVVTLSGTVDKYQVKLDAEKKTHKLDGVKEVDDQINVGGKSFDDATLQKTLNKKLAYDRAEEPTGPGLRAMNGIGGYENVFDNLTASVQDGVVTLEGQVRWSIDRDSAIALIAQQAGVKDLINKVKVLPTSHFDDQLREREYAALYGDEVLGRYGLDPAAPIRIVVDNGHVSLYGSVETQNDKNVATIRANGVFGAFSVENHLTVNKG